MMLHSKNHDSGISGSQACGPRLVTAVKNEIEVRMARWLKGGDADHRRRQVNVHHIIITDRQPAESIIAKGIEREVGILINTNHR